MKESSVDLKLCESLQRKQTDFTLLPSKHKLLAILCIQAVISHPIP